MGVGRSNNYLESMAAGISLNNTFKVIKKTPIIPNS
jgi:hypothetical protein